MSLPPLFRPAQAPTWLPPYTQSVERALRQVQVQSAPLSRAKILFLT